jgi:hypothetical protein
MANSVETKIVELHLSHCTQHKTAVVLHLSKIRVPRLIQYFHYIGRITKALRILRPSKRIGELAGLIDSRTIQGRSVSTKSLVPGLEKAAGQSEERCYAALFHSHPLSGRIARSGDLPRSKVK